MDTYEFYSLLKKGVYAWNKWRELNPGSIPDLSGVIARQANLKGINLANTKMVGAKLREADLIGATFVNSDLWEADLSGANLTGADLSGCNLVGANLGRSTLNSTNINKVRMAGTDLGSVDLSQAIGLETVEHRGPSSVGIDTVYKSNGNIPESFLRGTGVSNVFIEYARSLVGKPKEFFYCFISYSSRDQAFVEKLHLDLQRNGVRCWFDAEDLKIGADIGDNIHDAIGTADKMLLVFSESALRSSWVEREVKRALAIERNRGGIMLVPIRVDDSVMETNVQWAAMVRENRLIGDFRKWQQVPHYQKCVEQLMRALRQS